MFKSTIGIKDETTDNIKKVCEDISLRDEIFKYEITEAYGDFAKQFKNVLIIYGDSRKYLYETSGWFIHKVTRAKLADFFVVREIKDLTYLKKNIVLKDRCE